jgi:hypothetical protein
VSKSGRLVSGVVLCCLAAFPPGFSAPPAQPSSIDYLYPEAFRTQTWIQVPLPSSQVSLANLRVITANRKWKLEICGSASNPATCVNALAFSDPRGVGWRGDFASTAWSQTYQDTDAVKMLHLRVTPLGGDWMIFRIRVEATPIP